MDEHMTALMKRVYDVWRSVPHNRRAGYRWVLSPTYVATFYLAENDRRREERQRLANLHIVLPDFDPTEYLKYYQPCPPPPQGDEDAGGMRLLGCPVRIADVDEITIEVVD